MADIYTAVKPTLLVSKIMGLGPFYIDGEKKSFRLSIPGMVYSAGVLLVFGGNSAYVLYTKITHQDGKNEHNDSFISEANDIIQMACGIAVTICTILLTVIQRNKFIHVVQNLHEVSVEMSKLDIILPYHTISKYSKIQIMVLFLFILALLLHDFLAWASSGQYYDILYWISYFLPNFFNFVMEYQFISGALLLKKHFTLLNNYLMKFNDHDKLSLEENKKLDINVNNNAWMDSFDSHMGPKIVDSAWDGNFSRFRVRKVAPTDNSLDGLNHASLSRIKVFRKIHSSLCETKESLNSSFSLQLLASVAQAFVIITSDLYLLFTNLSKQDKAHASSLTYPIVWSLTHVIELVFVVVTCTKTSKQLKLFSIQLLHRKISFTACGFFTLDMTLLQAIIGAATTYLVILIQFHNTYEADAAH